MTVNKLTIPTTQNKVVLKTNEVIESLNQILGGLNLSDLDDVTLSSSLAAGYLLYFDGTKWVNQWIDTGLSTSSEHTVQNKAVATAVNGKSTVTFVDWTVS